MTNSQGSIEKNKIVNDVMRGVDADAIVLQNKEERELADEYNRIEKMGAHHVGSIPVELYEAMIKLDPEIFTNKEKTLQFLRDFPDFSTATNLNI